MSTTTNTNAKHFQAARLLVEMMDRGMTFAQVTEAIGGTASAEDYAAMADTFRSDSLRQRFVAWVTA